MEIHGSQIRAVQNKVDFNTLTRLKDKS
jgi:hypothetical protein